MSNNFKISTKGLIFYAPLTDKYLQPSSLPSDLSSGHNHMTATNGSPTFSSAGMNVDTTDSVENVPTFLSGTDILSIAFRFTPDFDTDENTRRYFYDSDSSRYSIIKQDNPISNVWSFSLNGVVIANIPEATYSPFWKVNQENTLVITSTSGDTSIWFNGNQILTNEATAWTPGDPPGFHIGAAFNSSVGFDGKIRDFMVFNRILTDDERAAFDASSRGVYAPSKQSTLHKGLVFHAPLTDQYLQDDAGLLASEVSVKHNHANAVTGTPTYSSSGIDFNDATTKLDFPVTGVFNVPALTIAFRFTPDFAADDGDYHYLYGSSAPRIYMLKYNSAGSNQLTIALYGTNVVSVPIATYEPYWNANEENVLIITADDSANLTNAWLNGVQIVTDASTAFVNADTATFSIGGKGADGSFPFDGEMRDFRVYNRILSLAEISSFTDQGRSLAIKVSSLEKGLVLDMPCTSRWLQTATLASDRSVSNLHGTATGTPPTFGSDGVDLNGSSDYVAIPDDDVLSFTDGAGNDKPFTIGFWLNPVSVASQFSWVVKYEAVGDKREYFVRNDNDGHLHTQLYTNATNWIARTSDAVIEEGVWTHLLVSYNGGESNTDITLYINGEEASSSGSVLGSYSGMPNTTQDLWLGRISTVYGEGKVQNLVIYNRELSDSEVLALYNQGR